MALLIPTISSGMAAAGHTVSEREARRTRSALKRQYKQLGSLSYAEGSVLAVFCLTVTLWISRQPGTPGWSALFTKRLDGASADAKPISLMSDTQPAVLAVLLLFLLPSKNPFAALFKAIASVRKPVAAITVAAASAAASTTVAVLENGRQQSEMEFKVDDTVVDVGTVGSSAGIDSDSADRLRGRPTRLLSWDLVQKRVAWQIVLMLGAGFALADLARVSGLSDWIGSQMVVLKTMPAPALIFIICWCSALLTEWTSNGTSATILLPILSSLSEKLHLHPFHFMLACTASCSFAFILPISTPANILVYSRGYLRPWDMLRTGSIIWLVSNALVAAATLSYAPPMFGLREFPDWANRNVTV